MTGALMQRLYGSDDLFPDDVIDAYHAYQSVNYVTSPRRLHALRSRLVRAQAQPGQRPRQHATARTQNCSWNCGWEGDDGAPAGVLALRERQAKNLIALLLLSNGTPMLRAGDEFLQTQGGNNNPYNQDNETTWLDWRRRDHHAGFWRFVQQMIAFRKQHPSLARSRFWRDGRPLVRTARRRRLSRPAVAWRLAGASQGDRDLYVMVNGGTEPVTFVVQDDGGPWQIAVDTARPSPEDIELARPRTLSRPSYAVDARAVVVLVRER